jgi:molybdate transport system ATP-binding protein
MADRSVSLDAQVTVALNGFRLEADIAVAAGETVGVVGPNGAGKTTLLRTMAGVRALSSGRIALDGEVLDDPATGVFVLPERRPIGVVFQDNQLFPHLSALDNVAFGLRARGVRKTAANQRAAAWLDRVGLGARADARPSELSGGQSQRVALVRALAAEPKLLLLDEPLAALDATTRDEVRHDLRMQLSAFDGVRIVVTHDPVDAAVLADRIVVIDAGRVVQEGAPAEITARPRTPWVATLVGTNLFAGTAVGGDITLTAGGLLHAAGDAPQGNVFAVVHPRGVALHTREPSGSPRNTWRGRVSSVVPVGDRVRVRVDAQPPITAELTGGAAADLSLSPGLPVWVAVKATELDVFPA